MCLTVLDHVCHSLQRHVCAQTTANCYLYRCTKLKLLLLIPTAKRNYMFNLICMCDGFYSHVHHFYPQMKRVAMKTHGQTTSGGILLHDRRQLVRNRHFSAEISSSRNGPSLGSTTQTRGCSKLSLNRFV